MPTKLMITNFGKRGQQVEVVLLDAQGLPRLDAIVSKSIVEVRQIYEVQLLHDQALLVRPLPPLSAPPSAIYKPPGRPRRGAEGA